MARNSHASQEHTGLIGQWQNGADVISNSWSWTPTAPIQLVTDAINNVVLNGRTRNGVNLGCVVVFSTGNNSATSINFPSNSANVITVGAIDRNGIRVWDSNYGSELNVVAPGETNGIFTTDREGGYSNFGKTSAACPHVAGVAALMLSVNPNLTWQQVRNIIESTAQRVGNNYNYQSVPSRPGWNIEMGYGLVNAYAAVQQICPPIVNFTGTVTTPIIVTAPTPIVSCGDINVQYVKVQSNKLTLDAAGTTTINSDFEVVSGAELEIK